MKPIKAPTFQEKQVKSRKAQMDEIWKWIDQWTGHPVLIDFASKLIRKMNVPARDELALSRAVQCYAQHAIKYFREYPERWASPIRTVQWGLGDCDDKTILIASILRGFRIPVRLKRIRMKVPDKRTGKPRFVSHIYPQAHVGGKWQSLESVQAVPLGFDPADAYQAKGIPIVKTDYIGDKL